MIIDGKVVAERVRAKVAEDVSSLNFRPCLAVILVGENPASQIYVRSKERYAREVGIDTVTCKLPAKTTQEQLRSAIVGFNNDPNIHGILVQLPLPPHLDPLDVFQTIDPSKDVDGFSPLNVGRLALGLPGLRPCTPSGCLKLIKTVQENLSGLNALVIGTSNIVGKPMARMLLAENCTVTQAHIHTKKLPVLARKADLIVAAAGAPGLVQTDWVKTGAIVIDVGITRVFDKVVGDVDPAVQIVAGAMTPVPGGVGPMTIACLLENTVKAAKNA